MAKKKIRDPSMPIYVADWFGSQSIMLMTLEEEGAYLRLLLHAWASGDCTLPDDDQVLSVLSRLGQKWFDGSGEKIRRCFKIRKAVAGPRLVNEKLLGFWKNRREHAERCRIAGVKSGESRRSGTNYRSTKQRTKHPTKTNISYSCSSSSSSSRSIIDVWLAKVKPETLSSMEPFLAWFDAAVEAGAFDTAAFTRDRAAGLAVRCRKRGRNGGGGLFTSLVRAGNFHHANDAEFETALDEIREHERSAPGEPSEFVKDLLGNSAKTPPPEKLPQPIESSDPAIVAMNKIIERNRRQMA